MTERDLIFDLWVRTYLKENLGLSSYTKEFFFPPPSLLSLSLCLRQFVLVYFCPSTKEGKQKASDGTRFQEN